MATPVEAKAPPMIDHKMDLPNCGVDASELGALQAAPRKNVSAERFGTVLAAGALERCRRDDRRRQIARSRPSQYGSRRTRFSTLPGPDFGSGSSWKLMLLGTL